MSDYDPNRVDPRRSDQMRYDSPRSFNWNWIIGGLAALVVLVVALSFMGRHDQTAGIGQPPATTGQATPRQPVSPSPAPTTPTPPAPRPASPNQ